MEEPDDDSDEEDPEEDPEESPDKSWEVEEVELSVEDEGVVLDEFELSAETVVLDTEVLSETTDGVISFKSVTFSWRVGKAVAIKGLESVRLEATEMGVLVTIRDSVDLAEGEVEAKEEDEED